MVASWRAVERNSKTRLFSGKTSTLLCRIGISFDQGNIALNTAYNGMRHSSSYAARGITGDPSPSEADIRLTRRTVEAGRILELQLIDHVIIGAPAPKRNIYFSFKEAGVIG
jgi:hypothetical protein